MSEKIRIWADYYEADQSIHVFVNGYALTPEESTIPIAEKIAKAAGQSFLPIHTYKISGPPTHTHNKI